MDQIISTKMGKMGITGVTFAPEDSRKMTRYSLADTMAENKTLTDYHITPIGEVDEKKVIDFLRRFFFRDEPLNHSIQLIPEGENSTCVPLEEYSTSSINENLSLIAVSSNGDIIGVLLNGKTQAPEVEGEPDYIKNCENAKFKKIVKLLYHVDKEADLINRYPNKKGIDIRIISVDNNWRGRGIAGALVDRTITIANELKYDYLRADCTSHFTAKLCERLGFEKIFELNYADYVDEKGKSVFSPSLPHTAIATYVRKL